LRVLTQSCTFLTFIFTYLKDDRGLDAGRGWSQKALLRVGDAHVEGAFSEESRIAYDGVYCLSHGALRVGADHLSGNLIPIPLDVNGDVELMLECWGNVVRVFGNSAKLQLLGDPKYVEEFPRDGDNLG